ncbi:MAG: response regulator [Planktomarina sp.]
MTKNILIVEDDILIGLDLVDQVEERGFTALGPCATVDRAIKTLRNSHCDAAVLDVNLGDETSADVAAKLRDMGVPFVVVSGYSLEQMPEGFGDAPRLTKPVNGRDLFALLAA